jgi:hypothetical protein
VSNEQAVMERVVYGYEIRSCGAEESKEGDAQAQTRHVAQRTFRQEGHEPEAGNRDRAFGSAAPRRQSSKKAIQVLSAVAVPVELSAGDNSAGAALTAGDFRQPSIALAGIVDHVMYGAFRQQLAMAPPQGLVVIELSTLGGDPEVARMMGEDIRHCSELDPARRFVFRGKTAIYSAGTTFMSFFSINNRFLARGTRLMIHERTLSRTLTIDGPLTRCIATVRGVLNEIEASIDIQNEGFENLVRGSKVTLEDVLDRAPNNWYVEAQEALELGLIAGVI